jgi:hypothetical protein
VKTAQKKCIFNLLHRLFPEKTSGTALKPVHNRLFLLETAIASSSVRKPLYSPYKVHFKLIYNSLKRKFFIRISTVAIENVFLRHDSVSFGWDDKS